MLAASKDKILAELKQRSLCLRQLELKYYIKRYTNIATQCVILAGFAYESLVEITISPRMQEKRPIVCTVYYAASSFTMVFAMYTVYVASFATVFGHRLALQGPLGSVERAVAVMMMQRTSIFVTFGLAMLSLVTSAVTMAWIRMDATGMGVVPGVVIGLAEHSAPSVCAGCTALTAAPAPANLRRLFVAGRGRAPRPCVASGGASGSGSLGP